MDRVPLFESWLERCGIAPILDQDDHLIIPPGMRHIRLDIGLSFNAPNSQIWLQNTSDRMVFGFEPNPESVEHIKRGEPKVPGYVHLDPSHIGYRFHIIPCALGNGIPCMRFFHMTQEDPGCSSLHTPTTNLGMKVKKTIEVPCVPLSMFLDTVPWDRFPYIEHVKIDAQGHDLDILKGAGEYIKNFVFITIETTTHGQYLDVPDSTEIRKFIESEGFILEKWGINARYRNSVFSDEIIKEKLDGRSMDQ